MRSGIHGGRIIPGFCGASSEQTIEWYKAGRENKPAPSIISQRKLLASKHFWVKPEDLYLNEVDKELPKGDDFKQNRVVHIDRKELKPSCNKVISKHAPDPDVMMR